MSLCHTVLNTSCVHVIGDAQWLPGKHEEMSLYETCEDPTPFFKILMLSCTHGKMTGLHFVPNQEH